MKNLLVILAMLVAMNANAQWASYTLPYVGIPYTLGFYNLNNGVSLGHSLSPANENIYFTTNSGANWIQANYPLELRSIIDVQYINANIIYACGAENVTFRGNYNPDKDFLTFPKHIRDRYLRSGRTEFYSEYKAAFIKSTNGGLNWQRASQFDTSKGYIMDIHFFDASTGYALIDSNSYGNTKFFKTTDSGANWQFVHRIDNASVFGMHFFDMNTGFAYGFKNGGRIYRTTNAGVNWIVTNMASQIDGITFLNSTTGIAIGVGDNLSLTYIYKTTNAGLNWNVINTINGSKLFNNLKSLQNTGTAFAIGNNIDTGIQLIDKITTLKTTNYGLNWVSKEFNPKLLAYGLALVDANNFFMGAGEINIAAQILKSTNGGNVFVNQIGTVIPSAYSLSQNYPNPFNPVTIIRFSIPAVDSRLRGNDRVLLKVYDILGKEVQTLVNESLQPGTYETSFDGSSLTSGVYFYRLITNEFSETKKMLLIK